MPLAMAPLRGMLAEGRLLWAIRPHLIQPTTPPHPQVVDSGVHASPHSALISLLHTLSRDPHRCLRRLNTRRRRQLLSNLFGWVCGNERKGPHPSVLCRRGLMRRYAALLSTLVDDWPGDMEVTPPHSPSLFLFLTSA